MEDNDAEWAQLKKGLEKSRVQKIRKKCQKQNQMTQKGNFIIIR